MSSPVTHAKRGVNLGKERPSSRKKDSETSRLRDESRSLLHFRQENRDGLLRKTIRHAIRNCSFYKDFYHGVDVDCIRGADDLGELPLLTKKDVMEHNEEMISKSCPPDIFQFTSGRGDPSTRIVVYRSRKELESCKLLTQRVSKKLEGPKPLTLSFVLTGHGEPITSYVSSMPIIEILLTNPTRLERAAEMLFKEHHTLGQEAFVSRITGNLVSIQRFTLYLLDEGLKPSDSRVEEIHITGDYATSMARGMLSSTWNAVIRDTYSLAEILGGASNCEKCGKYHFAPYAIPEILDPTTKRPIDSGIGVVAFTTLFPFVQTQPFIRYWTEDLVELYPTRCPKDLWHEKSIEPRGRLMHSICYDKRGTTFVLSSSEIQEVLSRMPDIKTSCPMPTRHGRIVRYLGNPIFEVEEKERVDGNCMISLTAELRYHRALFPDRLKNLETHILRELCRGNKSLDRALHNGEIEFEIVWKHPTTDIPTM